jgi:hypothetical protein
MYVIGGNNGFEYYFNCLFWKGLIHRQKRKAHLQALSYYGSETDIKEYDIAIVKAELLSLYFYRTDCVKH